MVTLFFTHILAQYTDALRSLTGTVTGTWSEQHREMYQSRTKKDTNDVFEFVKFLSGHNPFDLPQGDMLMNIATGVVASDGINVDEAVTIGIKIHKKIDDTKFGDIKLVKADQAKTFMIMRKPVKVDNVNI